MSKYHINSQGVPALCRAAKGNCPFGGETGDKGHFDKKEDAQKYADKLNESEFGIVSEEVSFAKRKENVKQVEKIAVGLGNNEFVDSFSAVVDQDKLNEFNQGLAEEYNVDLPDNTIASDGISMIADEIGHDKTVDRIKGDFENEELSKSLKILKRSVNNKQAERGVDKLLYGVSEEEINTPTFNDENSPIETESGISRGLSEDISKAVLTNRRVSGTRDYGEQLFRDETGRVKLPVDETRYDEWNKWEAEEAEEAERKEVEKNKSEEI